MIPTFADVMRLTSQISCHEILEPAECEAMYDTLVQLPDGATVVEVGCDYGRSSSLILQLAAAKHFLTIHVDPWHSYPERAAEWMELTCETMNYHPFILLRMTTLEAADHIVQLTPRGIDLAFIDGSHDQKVVEWDLAIVANRVRPGGFLTAHDYPSAGVSEAIDAYVATGWTKVRQADPGFGVWRRT
jgi:predicted O-methyltransferase YrrM